MTDEELVMHALKLQCLAAEHWKPAYVTRANEAHAALLARLAALRAEHTDRATLARQVQIARMALADIAEGRDEVQCLAGGPAEPGRHCVVHDGARGCQACQAADRVARLQAVAAAARRLWQDTDDADMRALGTALRALDGGRDG